MMDDKAVVRRNRFCFGLGTVGRDMVYTLVSMYLLVYITGVVGVSDAGLAVITGLMMAFRIFDALNDPIMGTIVDNTKSKWGKYKPWILFGMLTSGVLSVILFTDFQLSEGWFIAVFAVCYLMWGMAYTSNDISYWSLMPALSKDQKERERIGAFARICANVGMFTVVILWTQIESVFAVFGEYCYTVFAAIAVLLMWGFQLFTLFGVREKRRFVVLEEHTTLKGMTRALFKNDQLLITAIAMALFMIGYCTTTSFGVYYFRYAYKNEDMYMVFAAVLAVAQLVALVVFPLFSKRFTRKQIYFVSMLTVCGAYILFFCAPFDNIALISVAGLLLFFAEAFIQLLMLVFLADTVEYGEWKLNKRNESVSFAVQPFINKLGGALGTGIVGLTLIVSGLNGVEQQFSQAGAEEQAALIAGVENSSLWIMKIAMLILPLICVAVGFLIYRKKYIIDKEMYDKIITELDERKNG
ncbi:MAG: glycoside-pentoside-hexuronide (GPH):cation symporter [Clostridia bacterium]|nr:glycoside-pentoside-hexuronide (GPH):cation symporter [Clostridia bacterium]